MKLKKTKATRKHRTRQRGGEDYLPITHFAKDLKSLEEYEAMPYYKKMFYEHTIKTSVNAVLDIVSSLNKAADKAYYIRYIFIINRQLLSILAANTAYRNAVINKIYELETQDIIKAYPDLIEIFDFLKQYGIFLKSITAESIKEYIATNNIQQLEKIFYEHTFRALLESDKSIGSMLFYSSNDAIFNILKYLFNRLTNFSNLTDETKAKILANCIDPTKRPEEFVAKINKLDVNNSTQGINSKIVYALVKDNENEKLKYFLDALRPLNMLNLNPTGFPWESGKIIMNYITENQTNATEIAAWIPWIEWVFKTTEGDEDVKIVKTKQAIDVMFTKFKNIADTNIHYRTNTINGLLTITNKIKMRRITSYILQKIVDWYKPDSIHIDEFKLLFKNMILKTSKEGITFLISLNIHTNEILLEGVELAKSKNLREIEEFLRSFIQPESMWAGWSRSDISKFDMIFSDEGVENYSICPICLKYVERTDGCLYMSHDCATLGGYYHKELYKQYVWGPEVRESNRITWCTTCGRICYSHQHYKIGNAGADKPELYPHGTDPFEKDCRKSNHGGGFPEKVARYRRAREYALELQEEIGKISQTTALNELVEQIWNAPSYRTRKVDRIIAEKAWNIPSNRFPLNAPAVESNSNAPNIPYTGSLPVLHARETEEYTNARYVDDENILQFRHVQANGIVNNHDKPGQQISREAFRMFLADSLGDPTAEGFGKCWQFYTEAQQARLDAAEKAVVCTATLHPEEVKAALDMEDESDKKLYEGYRKQFNRKMSAAARV